MGLVELIKEINENKLRAATAKGIAEGIAKGKVEGKIELTYKLLRKGKTPEQIHQLLELPVAFILKVKKKQDVGVSLEELLNQVEDGL